MAVASNHSERGQLCPRIKAMRIPADMAVRAPVLPCSRSSIYAITQDVADQFTGHAPAPDHVPDLFRQHKFDFTATHLLIEAHGGGKLRALPGAQSDGRGQAGTSEESGNPVEVPFREPLQASGNPGGGDLPDGNGFAM